MHRRIWAALTLSCVALGACQLDSREFDEVFPSLRPAAIAGGGRLLQPSTLAYGPITREFGASARVLVENVSTTTLGAASVSLEGPGASAFTLTRNDCAVPLARDAYCAIAVVFRPSDLSAHEATMYIAVPEGTFDIPLSGSGLQPGGLLLQAAPGSDALLGSVPLGGEQEATLQLANPTVTSSGPVELISNNPAFRVVPALGSECVSSSTQLASGQSCSFRVRFEPVLRGTTDATITARSAGLGSVSLSVSGQALAPAALLVDPARLDFGDVVVDGTAVLNLTIGNGGDAPLPAIISSVSGAAASDFRVSTNGCATPRLASETCTLSVSFSPQATGPHGAALELAAGSAGSLRVDLSGAGLAAGNLQVLAADVSDGDFGSVPLGGTSERLLRIVNISNQASGPITFSANSGEFSPVPAAGSECASGVTSLAGGARCDVRMRFVPTQRRQRNATFTVSSTVGGAALNLSGVGLASAEFLVDDPVDFGSVPQGSMAARSVIVTNAGDESMPIISTLLSGAASFSERSNGCRQGLDGLASCEISIQFRPSATGSHLGTLTLASELGTREVTLSGTGLASGALAPVGAPASGTLPASLIVLANESNDFGNVGVNESATRSFTLENTGDVTAGTLSEFFLGGGYTLAPSTGAECQTDVTVLDGGASCSFRVLFQPTSTGSVAITLGATTSLGLAARLFITGAGVPTLSGSTNTLIFDTPVNVGAVGTETQLWTIRNTASTAIDRLIFSVANSAEFPASLTGCAGGLLPDQECTVSIQFAPDLAGQRVGSLTVRSDDERSTSVTLFGTAN